MSWNGHVKQPHQPVGPSAGLGDLLSIYADASLGFRAFLVHRWWHASLPAIERHVPPGASVLELGCGHGIVANFIGLRDASRTVLGFEQETRKAVFGADRVSNVTIEAKDVRGLDVGRFDVVMLVDVLHHLNSYDEQEPLIDRALDMVRPGGTLIVKEVSTTYRLKFQLTLILDRLAYPGDRFYFRPHQDFQRLLERRGLAVEFENLSTYVPYAHVMFACRKPR